MTVAKKLQPIEDIAKAHADDLSALGASGVLILYRWPFGDDQHETRVATWGDPAIHGYMADEYAEGVLGPFDPEIEAAVGEDDEDEEVG